MDVDYLSVSNSMRSLRTYNYLSPIRPASTFLTLLPLGAPRYEFSFLCCCCHTLHLLTTTLWSRACRWIFLTIHTMPPVNLLLEE